MPGNITDANVFTDPVNTPLDGESATGASVLDGLQDLANRTRFLKNLTDTKSKAASARYTINATSKDSGTDPLFDLTAFLTSTGFVLAANEVQVPQAGRYLVSLTLRASFSAVTNPLEATVRLGGGFSVLVTGMRWSATNTHVFPVSLSAVIEVTDPATQKLSVEWGAPSVGAYSGTGRLNIVLVSA